MCRLTSIILATSAATSAAASAAARAAAFFAAAVLAAAAVGCTEKPGPAPDPQPDVLDPIVSSLSFGWVPGDRISVFNGLGPANARYGCISANGVAIFGFLDEEDAGNGEEPSSSATEVDAAKDPCLAAYPFDASYLYSDSDFSVSYPVPASLEWTGEGIRREEMRLFGRVEGGVLSVAPVSGILGLSMTGNMRICTLTLSAEVPLSGTAVVAVGEDGPVFGWTGKSSKSLTVNFDGGHELDENSATELDIIVPAGRYGSLSLLATDADGKEYPCALENVAIAAGESLLKDVKLEAEEQIFEPWPESGMESKTYITNGVIQIGVDMSRGGCIFHFSDASLKKNVLNHYDNGRFVQQSFYGDEDGSLWAGNSWCYNPVQGGGYLSRYPARIVSSEVEPSSLSCVSVPYHWANCVELSECLMTESIALEGPVAHIRYTFKYDGTVSHASRHQELPAVFCNWEYSELHYYNGAYPWQGQALSSLTPDNRLTTGVNQYLERNSWTERWAAYTDADGYGIGVYSPSSTLATFYRTGYGPSGATKSSCSYIAPLGIFGLTPGLEKTYDVYMTLGTVDEIRARFKTVHDGRQ